MQNDLYSRAKELITSGLDSRKVWNTLLFHCPDSAVHAAYSHKRYGYLKKKDGDPLFHDHVMRATSWFRSKIPGGVGPRARAMDKERRIREGITTSAQWATHASLILAHDMPGSREGGAKDFFLASPWQFLNTFTQSEERNPKTRQSIAFQRRLLTHTDSSFKPEWVTEGQPLTNWPHCSIYNSRCDADPALDASKREYFFTIDVDGKHVCDAESIRNKSCEADILLFEQTHTDGSPARLCIIGEAVKDAFREIGFETHISWHKSLGWKPSWRGYAVGAFFQNPTQAKQFVAKSVLPKLQIRENKWFVDEVFDLSSYNVGLDRCIGSAKLVAADPKEMRFLDTSPLEGVSDRQLTSIFFRCPNEYLLTVLGWIYPDFPRAAEPHRLIVQGYGVCAATKNNKRKRDDSAKAPKSTAVCSEDGALIQQMVAGSLEAAGFATGWEGFGAVRGVDRGGTHYVEIRAAGSSFFCAYNECESMESAGWNPPARKAGDKVHTSAGKIKFRLYLTADEKCPDKRFWLKQNCFSCDNHFRRVCPVDDNVARQLLPRPLALNKSPASRRVVLEHFMMDLNISP